MSLTKTFTTVATTVAEAAGKPVTFMLCCGLIVAWAVSGPIFKFSDTWQLVINTGTTIITFLMVFLIQNTQDRDGAAVHAKLDEIIRASQSANRFVGIEKLTLEEIEKLRDELERAVGAAKVST